MSFSSHHENDHNFFKRFVIVSIQGGVKVQNGNFQPFYLYYFDVCSGCAGTRRVTWWCWLTLTSSPWPPWRARASPQSSSSNNTMEWLSSGSVFSSLTLTVLLNLFGNTMREKVMKNNRRSLFKLSLYLYFTFLFYFNKFLPWMLNVAVHRTLVLQPSHITSFMSVARPSKYISS